MGKIPERFDAERALAEAAKRRTPGGASAVLGGGGGSGAPGADGADAGLAYSFDTTITMADPGTGDIRFNNATIGSVTEIALSDTDDEANNNDAFLDAWDDSTSTTRGLLLMTSADGQVVVFSITAAITDEGAWHRIPVTHVSGVIFSADEPVRISFFRTGDKGDAVPAAYCRATRTSTQSINNASETAISFTQEDLDSPAGMHSTASNQSRIVAPATGIYVAHTEIGFDFNGAGIRVIYIAKNGDKEDRVANSRIEPTESTAGPITNLSSGPVSLVANDYLEVYVYQDCGVALNVIAHNAGTGGGNNGDICAFTLTRIA